MYIYLRLRPRTQFIYASILKTPWGPQTPLTALSLGTSGRLICDEGWESRLQVSKRRCDRVRLESFRDSSSLYSICVRHRYSIIPNYLTRTEMLPLPSFKYDNGQGMHLISTMAQRLVTFSPQPQRLGFRKLAWTPGWVSKVPKTCHGTVLPVRELALFDCVRVGASDFAKR